MPRPRPTSLASVVADQARRAPRTPWVEAARDDRVVDRARLADVVTRWADQGLAGCRAGLLAEDPVAFAVLLVALVAAGATVVPVDAAAPEPDRRRTLQAGGADLVVSTEGDGVGEGVGTAVVTASPDSFLPTGASRVPAGPPDGGVLLFSSGSTGPRKAIRLPQAQLLHVARAVARAYELGPADRGLNPLPLIHVNGEVVGLLAPLVSGGIVVLDGRFHRTGFWELVDRRAVTWVNAVPAIVAVLAQEEPGVSAPPAPSRLRFVRSASAPLPAPVLARFEERYRVPVVESYGMTEAASQITANPVDGRRAGTVGVPVDVDLRVVGAARGETGRIQIRGPGVIDRYDGGVGDERFDADGWLDTGDLGSLDEDGFLTLAGRDGDVVNRAGEKVFPREVEDVLLEHPGVAEAVVFARPDPVLGEVPVAYVRPSRGPADADGGLVDDLVARCADALPRTHRPVEIRLVDDLPRGPTGKVVRRLVAEGDRL